MESGITTIILAASLFIIMLGMGLSLTIADFKRVLVYPKAVIIGLTNQMIILPLLGFGICMLIPMQPEVAIGIIILAACPGGPTSNLITHLSKGDTALSVTLTAISSFLTILTIPFVINLGLTQFLSEGKDIQLDAGKTIIQILVITIIPIAIGMMIKAKNDAFSQKMERPVKIGSGIVLSLVIIGIIIKEKSHVIDYFQQAGLAALSLNVLSMIIAFYSAKILSLKTDQAITISIESGIQNGTLAIAIATTLLSNTQMAIAPAVYSLIMFFTGGFLIYRFGKKTN
jgi:bile acid:Na+ symporter, BASS family